MVESFFSFFLRIYWLLEIVSLSWRSRILAEEPLKPFYGNCRRYSWRLLSSLSAADIRPALDCLSNKHLQEVRGINTAVGLPGRRYKSHKVLTLQYVRRLIDDLWSRPVNRRRLYFISCPCRRWFRHHRWLVKRREREIKGKNVFGGYNVTVGVI